VDPRDVKLNELEKARMRINYSFYLNSQIVLMTHFLKSAIILLYLNKFCISHSILKDAICEVLS
jgi:hypothetical protein